mgnify:CR=1 FL=1
MVMHDFLASGLRTVIVTTMADSLGADAIGQEIDPAFIASLPAGVDPNGENGEYHTFCYDGPIFRSPPSRSGSARLCAEVTASALTTDRKRAIPIGSPNLQQA